MRLAVLGVGLIGGSIGLAARQRLRSRGHGLRLGSGATRTAALELGALDRAAASIAEAVDGAEIVFCAAPDRRPRRAGAPRRSRRAAEDAVVTDVGSTKEALLRRAVGRSSESGSSAGIPLAGAETAGVENARADLFEGARWYLTPDRALERRPLRPPAANDRRPRRPPPGDRRRDPRPADGDGQPRSPRDRQRPRSARRRRPRPRSPSACPRSARAFATRPGSPGRTRPSGATSSPPTARRSPARSRRSPSGSARPPS